MEVSLAPPIHLSNYSRLLDFQFEQSLVLQESNTTNGKWIVRLNRMINRAVAQRLLNTCFVRFIWKLRRSDGEV